VHARFEKIESPLKRKVTLSSYLPLKNYKSYTPGA
jgi:hypothetical protein